TALKAAGLSTDVSSLLDFIRLRSRETITRDELTPLLKELASPDPKAADKAAAALVARGPLVVPSLRKAANDLADKPLADRARKCVGHIEGRAGADLAASVVRLLGTLRAQEAVEPLLAYLVYADE